MIREKFCFVDCLAITGHRRIWLKVAGSDSFMIFSLNLSWMGFVQQTTARMNVTTDSGYIIENSRPSRINEKEFIPPK